MSTRHGALDLTAIRQNRRISIEEISCRLRISGRYLRAIEEGRLDKPPGEFYARSYVRQYARASAVTRRHIGAGDFDETELLENFDLLPNPEEEVPPRTILPSLMETALGWLKARRAE